MGKVAMSRSNTLSTVDLVAKAQAFRALHAAAEPLVLPNAWDAATAVLVVESGFPAVATTSAGVAWTLGRPDGQVLTRDEMLAAVARMAAVVSVPVTADLEAGYGAAPEAVAETVRRAAEAGAVGLNIEDGIDHTAGTVFDESLAIERIVAARAAAREIGIPMVINARTDLAFDRARSDVEKIAEAVRRGNAYLKAGADCIYPILFQKMETIRIFAREIEGPINVMASVNLDVASLAEAGVKRISLATGLPRAAFGYLQRTLAQLKSDGRFEFLNDALQTGDVNAKFPRK
jgi:2-methylisocitrate lyase-like PEP mutase family enzyme